MKTTVVSIPTRAGLAILMSFLGVHQSKGDSLSATLEKDTFLLYELIVVKVTLRLGAPFLPSTEDPYEASRQLARLRRRLFVELRAPDGTTLTEAFLSGITFVPTDQPTQEFRTIGWGFLGKADRKGEDFEHWKRPGSYVLVVCDKQNKLESKEIPVTLGILDHAQLEAARIFASGGVDAISLVVQGEHWRRETLELFSRLARDYPGTIHGRYALASLALLRWEETVREHKDKGGSEVWAPVVDGLSKAATLFNGPHPLRARVLFRLAQAQIVGGNPSDARRIAELVSTQFPDTELGRKAQALLKELDE